jgi:hypothetical protein
MNRVILLLNVTVLVVNFMLALTATDSQIGLMQSTAAIANYPRAPRRGMGEGADSSHACLRVVQSLESLAPQTPLTTDKLQTIYDAVRSYRAVVGRGVARSLYESEDGSDLRGLYQSLGKAARQEIELVLGRSFSDGSLVQRLATEVIKSCR